MKAALTLAIQDPETGHSMRLELDDDFDTVFDRVSPLQQPSSNLEHRAKMLHTLADGRRIAIQPQLIAIVEEVEA